MASTVSNYGVINGHTSLGEHICSCTCIFNVGNGVKYGNLWCNMSPFGLILEPHCGLQWVLEEYSLTWTHLVINHVFYLQNINETTKYLQNIRKNDVKLQIYLCQLSPLEGQNEPNFCEWFTLMVCMLLARIQPCMNSFDHISCFLYVKNRSKSVSYTHLTLPTKA